MILGDASLAHAAPLEAESFVAAKSELVVAICLEAAPCLRLEGCHAKHCAAGVETACSLFAVEFIILANS